MGLPLRHAATPNGHADLLQPKGLKVIIVGGGIGGFTAALALRQQGHDVEVYESSGFSKEVGAALNTPPNANGLLKRLGISCEAIGACTAEWMAEWTHEGVKLKKNDLSFMRKLFMHRYRLAHRVKLHDALRKAATGEEGTGRPAQLYLSHAVTNVDTANGIVYFKNGTSTQGDVVIGADGVHSATRHMLPEGNLQPFPSGISAFRFLVPKDIILADPRTAKFAEEDGVMNGIFGPDRRIVIYPTANNTVLNFVCIHPDSESDGSEGWGSSASRSKLLKVYETFNDDVRALLEKADESSLKVWKLLDMAPLPIWHHNRLAVIGDAAHPFMPFLGQGAAIAMEDAVSIGVLLERGLSSAAVPERLKLFQDIRKERAELVQHYTRLSGLNGGKDKAFNAAQFQPYCFGWDEWDNSMQKLREWKWAKSSTLPARMANVFGPAPALSRQQRQVTFTTATIRFYTSRTILDGFLPPGNSSYKFKSSASITPCTVRQTTVKGLRSSGKTHNQLGLFVHDVEYKDGEGKLVNGAFLPIMFDDKIGSSKSSGQEDLGIPKVGSTINIERDDDSYGVTGREEGLSWGNLRFSGLELLSPESSMDTISNRTDASKGDEGVLIHQYLHDDDSKCGGQQSERSIFVPLTTARKPSVPEGVHVNGTAVNGTSATDIHGNGMSLNGAATAECNSEEKLSASRQTWTTKSVDISFNARDPESLPKLHHIISRLQELPIISIIDARVVEGTGMPELLD